MKDQLSGTPEDWRNILIEGETILWQGQPSPKVHFSVGDLLFSVYGLIFATVGLFAVIKGYSLGSRLGMIGMVHFTVGIGLLLFTLRVRPFLRRHSFYTLTNRRAIIARDAPILGRSLKTWPVAPASRLELKLHNKGLGSVIFAKQSPRWYSRSRRDELIGFEYIPGASRVFTLMSDLQRAAR